MGFNTGVGSASIAASADVALNNASNGQVLTYDASTQKWKNASGGASSDATSSAKGIVQLAGDLSGTAAAPTLSAIGSAVSATGSSSVVPVLAIDAKGRVVSLASTANMSADSLGAANNPVTDASAPRPTGLTRVYWICSTQPTNWQPNDEWINNS